MKGFKILYPSAREDNVKVRKTDGLKSRTRLFAIVIASRARG